MLYRNMFFAKFLIFAAAAVIAAAAGLGTPATTSRQIVYDISWPNCRAEIPPGNIGIVGVTGGLNFRPNKCLNNEARLFDSFGLYINTGYVQESAHRYADYPKRCPSSDKVCLAYNYGYSAGLYAVSYASSQHVWSSDWWLDVETVNSWSDDTRQNVASIQGSLDAVKRHSGAFNIGIYSHPAQWKIITGDWKNNLPAWQATGSVREYEAQKTCKQSKGFTGAELLMVQYTPALDQNVLCAGSLLRIMSIAQ